MRLEKELFLVLSQDVNSGESRVELIERASEAIPNWGAGTRISPVYSLSGTPRARETSLSDVQFLAFVGPVDPSKAVSSFMRSRIWVGLGLFNVIIGLSADDVDRFTSWAQAKGHPYEVWALNAGCIDLSGIRRWCPPEPYIEWRPILREFCSDDKRDETREAGQEYANLMAATLSRSRVLPPKNRQMLHDVNRKYLAVLEHLTTRQSHFELLGQILTMNAALSRYCSQTFAGSSPILATECHFWTHSLLGIGLATLALEKLKLSVESTMHTRRIPARFESLSRITEDVPDLESEVPTARDYLAEAPDPPNQLMVPVLPYFSAREGYRSTETTVSAPLASVSSCNSARWSLMTLTHEFSHIIMRSVLSKLYPKLNDPGSMNEAFLLAKGTRRPAHLLEEIRRVVLRSALTSAAAETGIASTKLRLDPSRFHTLLVAYRQDIDETMVHVFDYLYFYRDRDVYVRDIWTTWGTIPNVSSRVRDYVVRTVCAVLADHLERERLDDDNNPEEVARGQVLEILRGLGEEGGPHVQQAILELTDRWPEIRQRVRARMPLVTVVKYYLVSRKFATELRREHGIAAHSSERGGYPFKRGELPTTSISNPLGFVREFTEAEPPDSLTSAWMYQVLAFATDPPA